jgi:hypothetical protein
VTLNLTLTEIITIYFAGGLSWYVHDAAHVIATKLQRNLSMERIEAKAYYFRSLYSHGLVMNW